MSSGGDLEEECQRHLCSSSSSSGSEGERSDPEASHDALPRPELSACFRGVRAAAPVAGLGLLALLCWLRAGGGGFAGLGGGPGGLKQLWASSRPPPASSSSSGGGQRQLEKSFGTVAAIFTFGGPGVARPPLPNLLAEDGCFPGLRSYSEDVLGPITKQVDAASISNPFSHAKIATAVLRSPTELLYVPCPGEPNWPNDRKGDVFGDWRLHWQATYQPRLCNVTAENRARLGKDWRPACRSELMSFKTYDTLQHASDDVHEMFASWDLVAKETVVSGFGLGYDEDPVMLFQERESLDCVLSIAGINYFGSEIATAMHVEPGAFCGFEDVHTGYREQLRQLATELWPRLTPKFSKCRSLSCAGHSMGGALCELFAACANSQRAQEQDFQKLAWSPSQPAPLPVIARGSNVYLSGAERRCPRPPCPK